MLYTLLSLPIGCFSMRFQHQILPLICSLSHIHISSLSLSLVHLNAPEMLCKVCATHTAIIQSVPKGNVSIVGGHSSKKSVCVRVSYSERFLRQSYFTVQEFGFGTQYCPSLLPYCTPLDFCLLVLEEE